MELLHSVACAPFGNMKAEGGTWTRARASVRACMRARARACVRAFASSFGLARLFQISSAPSLLQIAEALACHNNKSRSSSGRRDARRTNWSASLTEKKKEEEGMCFLLDTVFQVITFQREHKPTRGSERRDSEDGNITGKGRSDPLSVANTALESLPMKESKHLGLGIKEVSSYSGVCLFVWR